MMSNEMFGDLIDWLGKNKDKFEKFKMEKDVDEVKGKLYIKITAELPFDAEECRKKNKELGI